ncbi:bifunctional 5,10-methylenetetrahydrofolate dehydrogenase/5,10-methenyltetrahydrofolate cyclohydrolase [Candidatus Bodocaedibacter vickermanii]|uniref:Bifunctional protein FolD n=1 Tax=Candidatus Bodocaedibacter vickermanii TaxID=2741701 RepID=A0A7L9RSA9_9PROT|nr:Bifunctional protein FolD protein [Candidatus Paracaedibacteraceae bacterium 'Lake Konstanz']
MTVTLINGLTTAESIRNTVKESAAEFFATHSIKPGLAVILIGENPASLSYVNIKLKRCAELGIHAELIKFDVNVSEDTVIHAIDVLNARHDIHGIIIQLPLPPHLCANTLIDHVSPQKDVDGLHLHNIGALHSSRPGIIPCTPKGVLTLLKTIPVALKGKHAVVIGRSLIVGRPMTALLLKEHCTVTHIHRYSENWASLTRQADIVVVATGVPNLLKAEHIKPGAVIIDVGSTRVIHDDGSSTFVGDVAPDVFQKAGYITPVPGGVGPMTVAMLLQNTVDTAWSQHNDR